MKSIFKIAGCLALIGLLGFSTRLAKDKYGFHQSGDITIPTGFNATVVADNLGNARHLAVSSNGDVYVKLEALKNGKGIMRLRDNNGDGKADDITGFGNYIGTGIAISGGYLYASSNSEVFRYKMNNGVADSATAEKIIQGLADRRQHNSKSISLDGKGNIYVNIGAFSNVCQEKDRQKGSKGQDPCPILEIAGGIWQFKADKPNQSYPEGTRYATGLRNVVGLDWNKETDQLFVMQHGRDMLFQHYPELYNEEQGAELPSEVFLQVNKGDDFGWPYCYYDQQKKQELLNPEYGGDGKTAGRCESIKKPVVGFPGHIAPNGLLFYSGNQFPAKYKNGAFIAFHGSWNRAPRAQEGYFVVFVPMKDGKATADYEIFADDFAGQYKDPSREMYRPCGLAQGPDGSLYISDDQKGRIWKISYSK